MNIASEQPGSEPLSAVVAANFKDIFGNETSFRQDSSEQDHF
jgi:hypothetical protein